MSREITLKNRWFHRFQYDSWWKQ